MLPRPAARIGGMATMPSRAHTARAAVEAVLPQLDRLYLYLDRHAAVPEWLPQSPKVVPLLPARHGSVAGDGKFLGLELHAEPCLFFCFDDDILYPPDYVEWMAAALRRHAFRAVVGVHGQVFRAPHLSYLRDHFVMHFGAACPLDSHVDELGTGTIAFYSEGVRLHPRRWLHHDMADLMVAIEAVRQEVPRIAVRRPKDFLRPLEENQADSIYRKLQGDDRRQTAIMRAALAAFPLAWQQSAGVPPAAATGEALGFFE